MKIKNRKNGNEFEVTRDHWETAFVEKGNAHLYDVIEEEAPLEVRKLREEVEVIKSKQSKSKKTEVKP